LPDPDLSELVHRRAFEALARAFREEFRTVPRGFFSACAKLMGAAGGRRRIQRCLQPA
jgi:hypothetical protein